MERTDSRQSVTRGRILFWIRLLAVLTFVLLAWRGDAAARTFMTQRARFFIDLGESGPVSGPAWLTPADVRSIRDDSGLRGRTASLFTPDLGRAVADAYLRSPWVRRVAGVRLRYPNRLHAYLEVRKPVAGVLVAGDRIALVDEEGRRLPGLRDRAPEGLSYPFLRLYGVDAPLPEPGDIWSREVTEGVAVVNHLLGMEPDMAAAARLLGVDVANVGGRRSRRAPEITLVCAAGTVIEWGRSPASPLGAVDPAVPEKLERLRRALCLYVGLEGLRTLKLQFDELYVDEGSPERADAGR